jgi:hypothetical protein
MLHYATVSCSIRIQSCQTPVSIGYFSTPNALPLLGPVFCSQPPVAWSLVHIEVGVGLVSRRCLVLLPSPGCWTATSMLLSAESARADFPGHWHWQGVTHWHTVCSLSHRLSDVGHPGPGVGPGAAEALDPGLSGGRPPGGSLPVSLPVTRSDSDGGSHGLQQFSGRGRSILRLPKLWALPTAEAGAIASAVSRWLFTDGRKINSWILPSTLWIGFQRRAHTRHSFSPA